MSPNAITLQWTAVVRVLLRGRSFSVARFPRLCATATEAYHLTKYEITSYRLWIIDRTRVSTDGLSDCTNYGFPGSHDERQETTASFETKRSSTAYIASIVPRVVVVGRDCITKPIVATFDQRPSTQTDACTAINNRRTAN